VQADEKLTAFVELEIATSFYAAASFVPLTSSPTNSVWELPYGGLFGNRSATKSIAWIRACSLPGFTVL